MVKKTLVTSQIFLFLAFSNVIVSIEGENNGFLRGHLAPAKIGNDRSLERNDDYYANETESKSDDYYYDDVYYANETESKNDDYYFVKETESESGEDDFDGFLKPVKEGKETLEELLDEMDDEEFFEELPVVAEEIEDGALPGVDDEVADEVLVFEAMMESGFDDEYFSGVYNVNETVSKSGENEGDDLLEPVKDGEESLEEFLNEMDDEEFFEDLPIVAQEIEDGDLPEVDDEIAEEVLEFEAIMEEYDDLYYGGDDYYDDDDYESDENDWEKNIEEKSEEQSKEDILEPVRDGEEDLDVLLNQMDDEEFFDELPEVVKEIEDGEILVDDELAKEVYDLEEIAETIDEINEFEKDQDLEELEEALTYGDDLAVFEAVDNIVAEVEEGFLEFDDDEIIDAINELEEAELEEEFKYDDAYETNDDIYGETFDFEEEGDDVLQGIYGVGENADDELEVGSSISFDEPEGGKLSFALLVFVFVFMIFTAYQVAENPDGAFASVCRLFITAGVFILKMLMYPLRRCFGGNYKHQRINTPAYSASSNFEIS